MGLLVAVLLAIFVVPPPWRIPVVVAGAAWELSESLLWIHWSRRRRAQVGAESLVGATARVVSQLSPEGQVQLKGELWRARSTGAETVGAGRDVRVLALEGLTLVVEPVAAVSRPAPGDPGGPAAQSSS